ncbi:FAD-binding oxidoreductase [Leptothrix ochracea]|uniref:FAD-binding oxidoreductase n=1 Tax=Leptothrix ochracea TaxID=735331 RepID=UPI0034E1B792
MTSLPLIAALQTCVGARHVLVEPTDIAPFMRDWRKRYVGQALAVVQPATTAEVAAVMRLCHAHRVAVVPQGGNTSLVGGAVPDTSGQQVLLSLRRLQHIRAIDRANLTMTVEAGCILQDVQIAAQDQGLLFPLSLASEGSCTLGGNLASNAGGTQVLRYGNARDLCLGLEVVTPSGEIWHGLSGLRKDNTGYALQQLYIGSEGTLGVITAAVLKLFPQPRTVMTALASCGDIKQLVTLLGLAQTQVGAALTGFEVMGALALDLVRKHCPQLPQPLPPSPWMVLIELSDADNDVHAHQRLEDLLGQALAEGVIADAAVAMSGVQSQAMWHLREAIPLAQALEGLNIKHDIAVPISAIPAFVAQTDAALHQLLSGVRLVTFGHLGDGNLHYNVQVPEGGDAASFLQAHEAAVNAVVYDAVQRFGGSISAEHGIGQLKREELAQRADPVGLGLMRTLKQALDPDNRMNPGRVIAASPGVA